MQKNLNKCDNILNKCAQEIASSTSSLINYDVLITDTEARIVGTSRSDRLGQLHEASIEVINSGLGNETTSSSARQLRGTFPGVTLPIFGLNKHVMGTIAIAGNPDDVRPFGLIVKKQIEILLREKELYAYSNNREAILQSFIQDLGTFVAGVSNETVFASRAAELGWKADKTYIPIAIDLYQFGRYAIKIRKLTKKSGEAENRLLNIKKGLLASIRSLFKDGADISVMNSNNSFVILHAILNSYNGQDPDFEAVKETKKLCDTLQKALDSYELNAAIGIGSPAHSIKELANNYAEAWKALRLGKKFYHKAGIYCIQDFRLEELVSSIDLTVRSRYVNTVMGPVLNLSDKDELLATLRAWCESGFSLIEAARKLHIHRNTLIYRLDKLSRILEMNVREFRTCFNLYFALILGRHAGPTLREKENIWEM